VTIEELIKRAHETAVAKGWWDQGKRPLGEQFANFHSELSEAWEHVRNGERLDAVTTTDDKPEGFVVELADVWIRMADTLGAYDLTEVFLDALAKKLAYNETRPYRHGGKIA